MRLPVIGFIIYGRLKSTRLPSKGLLKLENKSLIRILTERISASHKINKVVFATSDLDDDKPLVDLAKREGLEVYCGDPEDVLLRLFNTAQYFGCQYVSSPGDYADGNNYIGIYNQKGTTKDDTEALIESNDFNINSNNLKFLKRFYVKMTTPTTTVNLYLMKEEDFDADDWGSAIELSNGWNTLPRTFKSRRFKYKITTEEETEFALQQIGFDFVDLGVDAH